MKVLGVIVNYRTADRAVRAIESLVAALGNLDARVTVVDNDSRDGSYEILSRAVSERGWSERVDVLAAPRNGGFGYGNNLAIRRALESADAPEFVFMMNPDAIAEPGAATELLGFFERNPTAGIVGSRICGLDGSPHVSAFRFPSPLGELEQGLRLGLATRALSRWVVAPGPRHHTGPSDWVSGASFMVRRKVFDDIGLFDEAFFLYFEEIDLCARAAKAGWSTWYVEESLVRHEGAVSTGMNDRSRPVPPYWFDSRRLFFTKTNGAPTLVAANVLFTLGYAIFRVRRRIQRKPDRDPPHFLSDFVRHNFRANPSSKSEGTAKVTQ